MRCTLLFSIILLVSFQTCSSQQSQPIKRQKRQLFREQVLPQSGGKIPEDAFRSDRLALNRLNKEGIAIPDGILLETRHRESHFGSHRNDPDISASIIKLVQKPDGRYAPPEGRYPFNNLVESTYIIRPPINGHGPIVPPQRPHTAPLHLPARPFFNTEEDQFSLNHLDTYDVLTTFGPDLSSTRTWSSFGGFFNDVPNRILRQAGLARAQSLWPKGEKSPEKRAKGQYPSLTTIPRTRFACNPSALYMQPDPFTGCQVFHLCHRDGRKESFLCPQGARFDAVKKHCASWKEVPCNAS